MDKKNNIYTNLTTQELWDRWTNGDKNAAGELYYRVGLKAIFWCIKKFGIHKEDSKDLVQETFIKILETRENKKIEIEKI